VRAKFSYIDDCIKIGEGIFPVLVIENKKLYRGVLSSFLNSCEEDYFVFSEDFKPFEFSKDGCFISEPIFVDMNSRKLLGKLDGYMQQTANDEFAEDTAEVKAAVVRLADKLKAFCDFDCEYSDETDTSAIIKLMGFRFSAESSSLLECFVNYLKLSAKYLKTKVFVAANICLYFSPDEISELLKALALEHINFLMLENSEPQRLCDGEKLYVVDNDLCVIDDGDT
jgi:CRISPR type II-A-associated protein Csn2